MTEKYFIFETQHRPDWEINVSTVSRSTLASALSYYYERLSKMVVTELFTSVSVQLTDASLNVIQHETLQTQYKAEE